MGTETTFLHLHFPNDSLAELDRFAVARREARRPLTRYEWLTGTPEGRELWSKIQRSPSLISMRTTDSVNSYIQKEFEKATGGNKTGRPSLNEFRVDLIVEALTEYFKVHVPDKPPARGIEEIISSLATKRVA